MLGLRPGQGNTTDVPLQEGMGERATEQPVVHKHCSLIGLAGLHLMTLSFFFFGF